MPRRTELTAGDEPRPTAVVLGGGEAMIRFQLRRALLAAVLTLGPAWADRALAQAQGGLDVPAQAPGELGVPAQARPQQVSTPPLAEAALPRSDGRGPFALLLHIGAYSGFGAGVAVGAPEAGLRASVGWSPVLSVLRNGSNDDLKFYSGFQVSPDLYARLLHPRPMTHVGFQGGYRYSSLFGHGVAAGGYAQFALGGALDALLSVGFVVYPDGEDRLKKDQNLPASASFSFPGPSVNFGLSFGLAFFP